jgi:bifunctional DNA-binding transcriptional regulator/antitoxin component of YhaV-PrlF toxin-antitoxin module
VIVARRDAGGIAVLPSREYLVIPAVLRRRCGLRAGDQVLLAAVPGEDALAAYPIAVLDEALRANAPFPRAERHPRSLSVKPRRKIEGGFAGGTRRWPRRRGCGS